MNNKQAALRVKIIQEIKDSWPPHLRDEWISLGETCSTLDGNFSRNELRLIEVGMTTLAVRLKLEGEPEEGETGGGHPRSVDLET